jgi:hypothetical protein
MDKSVAHLVEQVERGKKISNTFVNAGTRAPDTSNLQH